MLTVPGDSALAAEPTRRIRSPVADARRRPRIAICMATYEPDPARLRVQLDSIRAQTRDRLDLRDQRRLLVAGGLRRARARRSAATRGSSLSRSPERLGFLRNFERAIALAPRRPRR